MKLTQVRLRNFRSHKDTEIHFGDGVTSIAGPNGSGKSSIFEGVHWCFYGVSRTRTQDELVRAGEREVCVEVEFETGAGETWGDGLRVERTFRLNDNGKGGTTRLRFASSGAGELTRATIAETEERIVAYIGPWDVMASTAYVGQGDGDRFLRARPADRRDIFARSLAISRDWDDWHKAAQETHGRLEKEQQRDQVALEMHRTQGAGYPALQAQFVDADTALLSVKAAVTAGEEMMPALNTQAARARAAYEQSVVSARRLQEARYRFGKANAQATDLRRQIVEAEAWIARADEIEKAVRKEEVAETTYRHNVSIYDQACAAIDAKVDSHRARLEDASRTGDKLLRQFESRRRLLTEIAQLEGKISTHTTDACPLCRQALTPEARGHVDAEYGRMLAQLKDLNTQLDGIPKDIDARLDAATKVLDQLRADKIPTRPATPVAPQRGAAAKEKAQLDHARGEVAVLRQRLAASETEATATRSEVDELAKEVEGIPDERSVRELETSLANATRRLESDRRTLTDASTRVAAIEARIAAADEHRSAAKDLETAILVRAHEIQAWDIVAEGCGPRGVRQLIADQALAAVQDEANRRLSVLQPGHGVYFATLTESGRETLDVAVSTPEGLRSYESLSGGEATRVAVAVRIAMSVVAANAHGLTRLPAFILDEAFGSQDLAGKDAFIECLANLSQSVGQVLVVSHDAEFQDRFERKIVLEKVDGETRVAA